MINYLKECYKRRYFIFYASYFNVKSRHFNSFFGNLWLLLNPILLAVIYYMLVLVLSSTTKHDYHHFLYIVSGIFSYYYTRNSIHFISTSLTNNRTLIKESSFPKLILPIYYLLSAVLMYIPTLILLFVMSFFISSNFNINYFYLVIIFILQTLFNFGLGTLCVIGDLYTKDIELFLPYLLRIWAYITPILFTMSRVDNLSHKNGFYHIVALIIKYNPLTPLIGPWNDIIVYGKTEHLFNSLAYASLISISIAYFAFYLFYKQEKNILYKL